jgi:hypothetical protein
MRPRRAPEPSKLFEAELRIHQVSKNNARRFRFITEKQSCSLIQERFGDRDVIFRQVQEPGRMGLSDFTEMSDLVVRVAGVDLDRECRDESRHADRDSSPRVPRIWQ